jgi:hypothetical protein
MHRRIVRWKHTDISGGTYRSALFFTCIHFGFLVRLLFEPQDSGGMFLPKRQSTFGVLFSVISLKTDLFTSILFQYTQHRFLIGALSYFLC